MTTTTHLYDLLYDAQANLLDAIEKLEEYVRATNDLEAESYILDDLLERLDDTEPLDDEEE